jgi:SLOG in TRPM, prokaryote
MRTVEGSFRVDLADGRFALAVRVHDVDDLVAAAGELGVGGRPVLVVVGGAGRMSRRDRRRLTPLFSDVLAPLAQRLSATVVDGGTDTGVMSLMGRAREAAGADFPLLGVIVEELTNQSSGASVDAVDLEPNHTHFVLVPGSRWGEEAPWLAGLATAVSGAEPSATVLVNGGESAVADVRHSIEAGRRVIVLDGSGRTADALAAAAHGESATPALATLAASGLVHPVDTKDRNALAWLLDDVFSGGELRE